MTISSHTHTEENTEEELLKTHTMSLHWILALTVTLLHCLTANSGPSPYHREIQRVIGDLQKVNCVSLSLVTLLSLYLFHLFYSLIYCDIF